MRWREERVRKADVPRRWLAEDQVLVKLASARPATLEELSNFRGLGSRMRDFGADGLLKAIRRGIAVPAGKTQHAAAPHRARYRRITGLGGAQMFRRDFSPASIRCRCAI